MKPATPKIERQVAIKTISLIGQEVAEEREYRERLFLEARAAGRLLHPGIVTIFDVGEDPESHDPFIVMEYVPGQSLDRLIDTSSDKKLALGSALQLTQEIAEALDYAHSQGVVHRDIKPTNILITKEGRAKVADFGIAKLSQSSLTLPGHLIGSPAYMAPEQLAGEDADGRADLFALGVILYTMVTGHRPFQGNSTATVAFKLMNRPPVPVSAFEANLPPELDEIVFRAIAKDPGERYQTGAEFAQALFQLRESCGLLTSTTGPQGNHVPANSSFTAHKRPPLARQAPVSRRRKTSTGLFWWGALGLSLLAFAWYVVKPFSRNKSTAIAQVAESPSGTAPMVSPGDDSNTPKPANLHIEIEYHFPIGQASIWLGGKSIYSQTLKAVRVKHALLFHEIKGMQSQDVQVEAGKHPLRVRVKSATGDFNETKTIPANFVSGKPTTLHITCDNHQLKLDLR